MAVLHGHVRDVKPLYSSQREKTESTVDIRYLAFGIIRCTVYFFFFGGGGGHLDTAVSIQIRIQSVRIFARLSKKSIPHKPVYRGGPLQTVQVGLSYTKLTKSENLSRLCTWQRKLTDMYLAAR